LQIILTDARRRVAVVEAVAEGDDGLSLEPVYHLGEPQQCLPRVVGREHQAAAGICGALLEMEVGDDQRSLRRPEEGAGLVSEKGPAANGDRLCDEVVESEALRLQSEHYDPSPTASAMSASAASRSRPSRAAPWTGSCPSSSKIGTASGDTLAKDWCLIRPFMRRRKSPRRAMSNSPVAASAQAASSSTWSGSCRRRTS